MYGRCSPIGHNAAWLEKLAPPQKCLEGVISERMRGNHKL
jgi:hypothetical protein